MLEEEDVRDDGRATFRFEGMQPGTYEAHIWFDGRRADPISFELPPGGDENLYFAFEPANEGR